MLMTAKRKGIDLSDVQVHAIWFHDIVYNVPTLEPGQNEHESAVMAGKILTEQGNTEEHCRIVEQIIMDTVNHVPTIPESQEVIDLDLWDLADPFKYWTNRVVIRSEFLTGVSEADFNQGRTKWLLGMLERKFIFCSRHATPRMDSRAKAHIRKELEDFYGWHGETE
jgi:predicted metal-dependent HD superfamily phosphohydrolase